MFNLPLIPKPFNYYAKSITGDYTLTPNSNNVIYAEPSSTSTVTLPDLDDVIDGFCVIIRNFGPADLNVNAADTTFIANMLSGSTYLIIADKQSILPEWKSVLGPIGGGSGSGFVAGPGLSTNNAIPLWNGTSGSLIKNSIVVVDSLGNMSGVGTLTTTGAAQHAGNLTLTSGGHIVYTAGAGNTTTFSNSPSGISNWFFRNVSTDTVIGQSTTDSLTNKTLISSTNNIASNFLNSATTQIQVSTATAPNAGQVLTATSAIAANWQNLAISVIGPGSSTVSAIALWNTTSGNLLKNSSVFVDSSGNITGVNNLTVTGNTSTVNLALTSGNIVYNNGSNSLTLVSTPTGLRTLNFPDTSDTITARNTTDTLTNKTLISTTNNINSNGLNTTGAAVIINSSAAPSTGQGLIATSATSASWQNVSNAIYTPTTPGNWLTVPSTIQNAVDNLSTSSGTLQTLGVDPTVTTLGSSQGTATLITKYFTNVTTAAASTGLVLPTAIIGRVFRVKNNGANMINVYPALGATINTLSSNTPFTIANAGINSTFIATSGTSWETLN